MTEAVARPLRLTGADVGIPPRQLDFRLPGDMPRWAYADNATATCFLAMLSAIFPPGEDFFVRSVLHFRDRITDPELLAQVRGFTGQEIIHSREHVRLNEAFTARGFDLTVAVTAIEIALGLLDQLPARQRITCTAMMEHFTAVFAEDLLTHEEFRDQLHPTSPTCGTGTRWRSWSTSRSLTTCTRRSATARPSGSSRSRWWSPRSPPPR